MSGSWKKGTTRREFLARSSVGLAPANVAGPFLKSALAQLRVPDPPGRKLGRAIVGLGSLAINHDGHLRGS
jgi:hypothetical protein